VTAAISDLILSRLPPTPGLALASPVAGIVVGFLIALLVVRLLATVSSRRSSRWIVGVVDIAAVPLVLGFAVIALTRLLEILPLG
jgi:uncharacterized membrane protein